MLNYRDRGPFKLPRKEPFDLVVKALDPKIIVDDPTRSYFANLGQTPQANPPVYTINWKDQEPSAKEFKP